MNRRRFLGLLPALGALCGLKPKAALPAVDEFVTYREALPAWAAVPLKFRGVPWQIGPEPDLERWFAQMHLMQAEVIELALELAPGPQWVGL